MSAKLYVNKLSAADRQLNCAVRLWFLEEDVLAVHTVASAAYALLSDLMQQKGKDESAYQEGYGLLRAARDIRDGFLTKEDLEAWGEGAWEAMAPFVEILTENPDIDIDQVRVVVPVEHQKVYWRNTKRWANFLKHADNDAESLLAEDDVENERLLLRAIGASLHLKCPPSREKLLFFAATYAFDYLKAKPHPATKILFEGMKRLPKTTIFRVGREKLIYKRLQDLDEQAEADALCRG